MRARDIHSSCSRGFSLFELLVCIGILALFTLIALPKMTSFTQQKCLFELRERLQRANLSLLNLYSSKILDNQSVESVEVEEIFAILTHKEGGCYFQRSKNGFIAHIEGKKLNFSISPPDLKSKPKIYCQLSNELCREFLGKTSKK